MKKLIALLIILALGIVAYKQFNSGRAVTLQVLKPHSVEITTAEIKEPVAAHKMPPESYILPVNTHFYQTFNNCGPATLSMILSYYNRPVSQKVLGDKLRPYQNPQGDNDDKSVLGYELVNESKLQGFEAMEIAGGNIDVLEALIANDVPVILKTWLNIGEDIGHYRLAKGYDKVKGVFIFHDSYQGPNKEITYSDLNTMWEPFGFSFILVYEKKDSQTVAAILGDLTTKEQVYKKALENNSSLPYPTFNRSVAYYYLGDYEKSINEYEKAANLLPSRMLWYQYEPIMAYKETGNYNKVFELTDAIFENGNRAFSELYQIRGEAYLESNNPELAKAEFQKAIYYNSGFKPAQRSLEGI